MLDKRSIAKNVLNKNVFPALVLITLGSCVVWSTSDLSQGSLSAMGPAMMPRWMGCGILVCGALWLVIGYRRAELIEAIDLRALAAVFAAIIIFAITIRTCGLAIAGPLTVIVSGLASRETKFTEIVIFGIGITVFCIALFHYALSQPIPVLRLFGAYI